MKIKGCLTHLGSQGNIKIVTDTNTACYAWALIPNHLIAVPKTKDGLNPAIGEAHRRYTRRVNFREGQQIAILRKHERTGRPLGEDAFIEKLESLLDRKLKRQKPGPEKDK